MTIDSHGAELMYGQTFPNRTEGSVKKHWYKVLASEQKSVTRLIAVQDMHYADFAEDDVSDPGGQAGHYG